MQAGVAEGRQPTRNGHRLPEFYSKHKMQGLQPLGFYCYCQRYGLGIVIAIAIAIAIASGGVRGGGSPPAMDIGSQSLFETLNARPPTLRVLLLLPLLLLRYGYCHCHCHCHYDCHCYCKRGRAGGRQPARNGHRSPEFIRNSKCKASNLEDFIAIAIVIA